LIAALPKIPEDPERGHSFARDLSGGLEALLALEGYDCSLGLCSKNAVRLTANVEPFLLGNDLDLSLQQLTRTTHLRLRCPVEWAFLPKTWPHVGAHSLTHWPDLD
jgi:hypothetical protein